MSPKILFLDIETSPNIAYTWGLWQQNVSLSQLVQPSRILCFSGKFLGDARPTFSESVQVAHDMISEADYVVTYNGDKFDLPILNGEFLQAGLTPPAPARSLDLYKVVKKNFKFPSHKLDYITKALGLEGKVQHEGFMLWVRYMEGDPKARKTMKKYNIQDVELLEELFEILRPWLPLSFNLNLYSDDPLKRCPKCGGDRLVKEGFHYTALGKYQRYSCKTCGAWPSDRTRIQGVDLR